MAGLLLTRWRADSNATRIGRANGANGRHNLPRIDSGRSQHMRCELVGAGCSAIAKIPFEDHEGNNLHNAKVAQ